MDLIRMDAVGISKRGLKDSLPRERLWNLASTESQKED